MHIGIERALSSSAYYQQLMENFLNQAKFFLLEKMIVSILVVYQNIVNL